MTGKLILFEVTGRDRFPAELLAEQLCFPATKSDAALIQSGSISKSRTIRLQSLEPPKSNRWAEKGWTLNVLNKPRIVEQEYDVYHTWPC
tara:strand:- start:177 stop:446 length:270 start_codon:yes stop_codon:yes gene_type:complete